MCVYKGRLINANLRNIYRSRRQRTNRQRRGFPMLNRQSIEELVSGSGRCPPKTSSGPPRNQATSVSAHVSAGLPVWMQDPIFWGETSELTVSRETSPTKDEEECEPENLAHSNARHVSPSFGALAQGDILLRLAKNHLCSDNDTAQSL